MKGVKDKNKTGLVLGAFVAVIHLMWALIVAILPKQLQNSLDWIYRMHFINPIYTLTTFNPANAVILIIMAFIFWYIIGWLYAAMYNIINK